MLDAEMHEVYWGCEAQRYGARDRILAATVAIVSSGTAVALFTPYPYVAKFVASFASAISIIHATYYHTGRLKQVSTLAARWKEIAVDYRLLWTSLKFKKEDEATIWRDFERISNREMNIDESAFHVSERRKQWAQDQVCKSRGLKHERQG